MSAFPRLTNERLENYLYKPPLQLVVDDVRQLEEYTIACRPVRCTSQELAVTSPAFRTLYYGNRGGGKSYSMLMNFARSLEMGYGHFYRGLLLGYEYKSLKNVINMSKALFSRIPGAKFYGSQNDLHWRFRCGETLVFDHAKTVADYENKIHGNSYAWLGVEESTNWRDPEVIDKVATTLRAGFKADEHSHDKLRPIQPLNPRMIMVANPSGPGKDWHRERYIDGHTLGVIDEKVTDVPVLTTKGMKFIEEKTTQVTLFGSFVENPYLTPAERARLFRSVEHDEKLFKMWILGSWDVVTGGALDDVWKYDLHVVAPFPIPPTWYVDRAHDWGSRYPSATVWFAESDGSAVHINGRKRVFPRGTLFAINELYTSDNPGFNEGTYASVGQVCQMIRATERAMLDKGLIKALPEPGPADSSIKIRPAEETPSISELMKNYGMYWNDSDSSPGARINGLQVMRQRLVAANGGEEPALYVCNNCVNILKLVPNIQRDERIVEDVDAKSEDHLYDAIRYRVLATAMPVNRTVSWRV